MQWLSAYIYTAGLGLQRKPSIHPSIMCMDVCRELFAAPYTHRVLTSLRSSHPVSQPSACRLTAFFTSCSLQAYASVTGPVLPSTLLLERLSTAP
ncbi:hypothetical protein CGRA01v4_03775 [Colletotrichum graminicola]|nr:hypothetical protein CGRA01v4_03775 [Colletotrichum graminicola]